MGLSVERNGYNKLQDMGFDIVTDLVQSGAFEVEAVDKLAQSSFSRINSEFVLKPTTSVDPLAGDTDQPWRLILEFSDDGNYINVWALTPVQISNALEVAEYDDQKEAGRLSKDNSTDTGQPLGYFFRRDAGQAVWSCYIPMALDEVDSIPLSYHLTVTDRGIFLGTWAEGYDKAGDCFNWFLIQRPVDCNTGAIIVDGKAPLVCLYSQYGNDFDIETASINDEEIQNSIQYFVVREDDINMPVPPLSAVVPTADSFPLINPMQQVALSEDGSFLTRFLHGFCTARYVYDYKLDMICYTSADVLSQYSKPSFTVFGESTPRRYKALQANFPNNTGMRILVQDNGKGI